MRKSEQFIPEPLRILYTKQLPEINLKQILLLFFLLSSMKNRMTCSELSPLYPLKGRKAVNNSQANLVTIAPYEGDGGELIRQYFISIT